MHGEFEVVRDFAAPVDRVFGVATALKAGAAVAEEQLAGALAPR